MPKSKPKISREAAVAVISPRPMQRKNLVWVSPEREYRQLGETRFEVSWEELRENATRDGSDVDIDRDLIHNAAARSTKQEADDFAQKVVTDGKTFFSCAVVTRQVVAWFVEEDRVAEWTDTADREEFS